METKTPVRFLRGDALKEYRKDLERRKRLYEEISIQKEEIETRAFDNLLGSLGLKDNSDNQGE